MSDMYDTYDLDGAGVDVFLDLLEYLKTYDVEKFSKVIDRLSEVFLHDPINLHTQDAYMIIKTVATVCEYDDESVKLAIELNDNPTVILSPEARDCLLSLCEDVYQMLEPFQKREMAMYMQSMGAWHLEGAVA